MCEGEFKRGYGEYYDACVDVNVIEKDSGRKILLLFLRQGKVLRKNSKKNKKYINRLLPPGTNYMKTIFNERGEQLCLKELSF